MGLSDLINKLAGKPDYLALVAFWEARAINGEIIITQQQAELNLLKQEMSKSGNDARQQMIVDYWDSWQRAECRLASEVLLSNSRLEEFTKLKEEIAAATNQNQVKIREFDKLVVELAEANRKGSKLAVLNSANYRARQAAEAKVNNLIKENEEIKKDRARLGISLDIVRDTLWVSDRKVEKLQEELEVEQLKDKYYCTKYPELDKCGCTDEYCMVINEEVTSYKDRCKHNKNNKEQCTKTSIPASTCPTTSASLTLKLQISLKGPPLTLTTRLYLQGLGWVVDTQHVNNKVTDYKLTYVTADQTSIAFPDCDRPNLLSATMQSLKQAGY